MEPASGLEDAWSAAEVKLHRFHLEEVPLRVKIQVFFLSETMKIPLVFQFLPWLCQRSWKDDFTNPMIPMLLSFVDVYTVPA